MHHLRPFCAFAAVTIALAAPSRMPAASLVPIAVPAFGMRGEWRLADAPVAENNCDPDQIRIDVRVAAPSGRTITVPAFWYQEFSRALIDGRQVLEPAGDAHWRVRFTPVEAGNHVLGVTVTLAGSPAAEIATMRFVVESEGRGGLSGPARVAADRMSFETSDGRPLRLIGENVCWGGDRGTFSYDAWFPALRDAGANLARLWFAPWSMGVEHTPGTLNRYDLAAAWQVDQALQLAEACGLHVVLAMDHHGMFMANDPAWGGTNNFWTRSSPYAAENGGPCATPNEFFTLPAARELYQKRLRYVIGRYGYSPNLLSWQFFNEIDNAYIPRSDLVGDDVARWHREMAQWLRAHDPYAHLISTSLTGASDRPELWTLPEMDFVVYHSYGEADPAMTVARRSTELMRRYAKPVMIGEIGTSHLNWAIAADPYLRGFRQGIWGGVMGGSVGTSLPWWWEDVHDHRAYPVLTVVRDVMGRAGWHRHGWSVASIVPAPVAPDALGPVRAPAEPFSADLPLNQLRLNRVTGAAWLADGLAVERAAERLSAYLHGTRNPQLQQHARTTAWFADGARVVFRINSVAADADLVVRIDGVEALRTRIADKDGLAALNDEINQEFAVPVPAGQHTVEIAHTGTDWINLKALRLERMLRASFAGDWQFPVEAVGLRRGEEAAVLYVRSPHAAWPAGATRFGLPRIEGAAVVIDAWTGGPVTVSWVDPRDGREIAQAPAEPERGRLSLHVPAFTEDLVAIISARGR